MSLMMQKNERKNYSIYLKGLIAVVIMIMVSGIVHANSPESSISVRVEGGNAPVKMASMEFIKQGKDIYLTVIMDFWDASKKSFSKTVKITPEDYDRLWKWVKAKNVWDLKDVIFPAVDAPLYTFHLKKGNKEKVIKALSVSTLDDRIYYQFYLLLKNTKAQYVEVEQ
jgi:hypothetical protein